MEKILIIDTETTNSLDDALVYDCGFIVGGIIVGVGLTHGTDTLILAVGLLGNLDDIASVLVDEVTVDSVAWVKLPRVFRHCGLDFLSIDSSKEGEEVDVGNHTAVVNNSTDTAGVGTILLNLDFLV